MNVFSELFRSFTPQQDGFLFMWTLAGVLAAAVVLVVERWFSIKRRTDVDGACLLDRVGSLVREERYDEAYQLCLTAGPRALPRILGAGIKKAPETPGLIRSAMEEETLHAIPRLEKRVDLILMFGNVSTLLGLMGTIYGLILSFAAVARPDVDPIEKSSLLAAGISTAMNTTLFGLMISVPCVLAYSIFRSKIDIAVRDIDRYAAGLLRFLLPGQAIRKDYRVSGRRIKQEVDTEPNIAPMMNLMVILIPLLLSSAEFVKIGAIELKLPESTGGAASGAGEGAEHEPEAKLNLGVVIKSEGFDLFHYFAEENESESTDTSGVEIPKKDGDYDFGELNSRLAEVKKQSLRSIIAAKHPEIPEGATLLQLYNNYIKNDYSGVGAFRDHEAIKIVAEDSVKYQVVVSVMDAARGTRTPNGKVTMFPNVSLAGGIVQ